MNTYSTLYSALHHSYAAGHGLNGLPTHWQVGFKSLEDANQSLIELAVSLEDV